MSNNGENIIENKIKYGEENSPFLFIGPNMELVHSQVKNIANSLLKKWGIPSNYFFILEDSDENLKIQDVKKFTELSHSKPPYDFQIFLIENIRRLTLTSSNSLLKFLEEPGKQNIIFLTNTGENGILDTILSRVQIIPLGGNQISKKDAFYTELIDHSLKGNYTEMMNYFFRNKLEKEDYVSFLENIILYGKEHIIFTHILEEVNEDINTIKQNNVNAKYIVDKWILRINS